jgi:hypothetical protein
MREVEPGALTQLLFAVAILSWPAEEQLDYLHRTVPGGSIDEFALEFDDVAGIVGFAAEKGWLAPQDAARIGELSSQLGRMSGGEHADLWTEAAVRTAPEWAQIRRLARSTIARQHTGGSPWGAP